MFGEVFTVLLVIAFWALVFAIIFLLVGRMSVERDDEEIVCELPPPAEPMGLRAQAPMRAQA